MKNTTLVRNLIAPALAGLTLLCPATLPAADVSGFGALKGEKYSQSDAATPSETFVFYWMYSYVQMTTANSVTEATMQPPGGSPLPLGVQDAQLLQLDVPGALTLADMNAAYPNGNYIVAMTTAHDGQRNMTLSLVGDSYPNTPTFLNFTTLEAVNPAAAYTLSWAAFTGGAANDFIRVRVVDADEVEVFSTPAFGAVGALTGTATSVVLPANTLAPESSFYVTLTFIKVTARDTTTYPGATGLAGYFKSTETSLTTTAGGGPDTTPPQLVSSFPTNGASGVATYFHVVFVFNEAMKPTQSIAWSANVNAANFTYAWSGDGQSLNCQYQGSLPAGVVITWMLNPSGQPLLLADVAGNPLPSSTYAGSFSTAGVTNNPCNPVDNGRGSGGVTKQLTFFQTGAGDPTLDPTNPPVFYALVASPTNNPVTAAKLQVPGGPLLALTNYFGRSFMDMEEYASQTSLDTARPNGTYTLQLTRTTGTPPSAGITLTGSYPPTPQILNYAAAQAIDPGANFVLQWNGFTGATANDSIALVLHSGSWTWMAPDLCVPRTLANTATSITLPAGTLQPGTRYDATLTYSRMTYSVSNAIPDIDVAAFLHKTVNFQIKTTGSGGGGARFISWRVLPNGSIELKLQGTPGSSYLLQITDNFTIWYDVLPLVAPSDGIMTYAIAPTTYGPKAFIRAKNL
ncbi:MAG: Ig-like domain-containing protein [Verrucomicrobia bacterium]|nr:Ig-like domain-containing protein [Verrucomicrobiota bacterium]